MYCRPSDFKCSEYSSQLWASIMTSEDFPVVESSIDKNQVEMAVKALFAYIQKERDTRKQLLPDKEVFSLSLALKRIPRPSLKPYLIPLQHSINKDAEVCLFSALPAKEAKDVLKEKDIQGITKVISMEKLKKEYKTFANRRELCSSFDVFLCDNKLFQLMPRFLGKSFYSRKKEPLPVNFQRDLKAEIEKALSSTRMFLGHGPCSNIKVGTSDQTEEQVKENITDASTYMAENIPGGWQNVKALYLKTGTSISLPIYNVAPTCEGNSEVEKEKSEGHPPEISPAKRKRRKHPLLAPKQESVVAANNKEVEASEVPKAKKVKIKPKRTKPMMKKIGVR